MKLERTGAEHRLVAVAKGTAGMAKCTQLERLSEAVNGLLAEAVRPSYTLTFNAATGLSLVTPSGLRIWFCSAHEFEGMVALVLDDVDDSDDSGDGGGDEDRRQVSPQDDTPHADDRAASDRLSS